MATQYTCSLNGVYCSHWLVQWSHHCSHMHTPVYSPWLSGYINVVQTLLIMLAMVGFFPDRPPVFRSRNTGSKGRSIFDFLWWLHTAFHSGCTNLHSHQQWKKCSCLSTSVRAVVDLLMVVVLTGVGWYLIVVLICISLMISDFGHLFICLLASVCLL